MKDEKDEELFDEKSTHNLDSIDPTDIGGLDHDSKVIDLDDLDLDLFPEE